MNNQTFSFAELSLLAEAFEVEVIFGMPDKKSEMLFDSAFASEAEKRLKEKKILSEESRLTEGGFYVVKALEEYCVSTEYLRINNIMIAFSNDKKHLIVLSEIESTKEYKLIVYDQLSFIKEMYETVPMINREPLPEDMEYSTKRLRNATRREWEKELFSEDIFNLEIFKEEDIQNEEKHVQWLFFEKEEKLIGIDVTKEKYYQFSQYYFLKTVFEALHISIEEVVKNQK
ncbi:DUF5081 family protein [Enterococcus sp. LJL128]|uniref:DUF5081 family protein n=1 Tax=Enterococcus sp. LJL51 TaxID=3416656 RepID=UPI003CEAB7A7